MQVDATFADVPAGPLRVRMSRTSPGRYALHEFAKNVFDVRVTDGKGKLLARAVRTAPVGRVRPRRHGGDELSRVRRLRRRHVSQRGRVAGHLNMPASLMWAAGLEARAARVKFVPPPGKSWKVATQFFPTEDPLVFTAPNLQYLMDSPAEVGTFRLHLFTIDDGQARPRRCASPCTTTAATARPTPSAATSRRSSARRFRSSASCRASKRHLTFLADYLPWPAATAWSTATAPCSVRRARCEPVAAQGHPRHRGPRVLPRLEHGADPRPGDRAVRLRRGRHVERAVVRRGRHQLLRRPHRPPRRLQCSTTCSPGYAGLVNAVSLAPGRKLRSAEQMSQLAPLVDAAVSMTGRRGRTPSSPTTRGVPSSGSASICRCRRRPPARRRWTTTCA